ISQTSGWQVVGVFPASEVLHDMTTTVYVMAISLLGALLSIAILSYVLSNTITKPLSKLQRLMEEAEAGDFSVRFNSRYTDEVGSLGQSFNHMLSQMEQLIQQVYVEQKNKRNAEMRILQEQIKPHFLYNTLDTISWLSRENGAEDVVLLVDALTSMFRVGLSKGRETITIKEEISHVSSYLYIQQIRYSTKLSYEVSVPEDLESYMVPKLILQPLVENAIYHGIKQKREKGLITVKVTLSDGVLALEVRDTGPGIEEGKLKALKKELQDRSRTVDSGFGLFYVNEQVKLSCGAAYGVVLDSVQGSWTTSTVYVPARVKESPDEKNQSIVS
ncbi:MAG TPA: sensor histidine kinase, partial [Sphaerochaeta sp.]|nr:sensor histidine kinase [Sphaerochaeta sp.]